MTVGQSVTDRGVSQDVRIDQDSALENETYASYLNTKLILWENKELHARQPRNNADIQYVQSSVLVLLCCLCVQRAT